MSVPKPAQVSGGANPAVAITRIVGIVAGEASGDNLGAGLMCALQARFPGVQFVGIGGPAMEAAGLRSLAPLSVLNVNGFVDPLLRLPSLLKLFNELTRQFNVESIDLFIGVDFNVFNLLLARRLKRLGHTTVHYVSPSVYAWRRGRIRRLGRAVDLLLTLYPFEPPLYEGTSVTAVCVGHPLADDIEPMTGASAQARQQQALAGFNLSPEACCIAVLPGSRRSELAQMLPIFLAACAQIAQQRPNVQFLLPCPRSELLPMVEAAIREQGSGPGGNTPLKITLHSGDAREVLAASTIALVKSGTSTLEAMLLARPMVVSYRLGGLTYELVKRLLRTKFVALPNILADQALVPELLQGAATPQALAAEMLALLDSALAGDQAQQQLLDAFQAQHLRLRRDASSSAAAAVGQFLRWS